jgi:hypothetical protein
MDTINLFFSLRAVGGESELVRLIILLGRQNRME